MIDENLKKILNNLKVHPRESYREVISKMAEEYMEEHKLKDFVKTAQAKKMKELWDNEKDTIWEKL